MRVLVNKHPCNIGIVLPITKFNGRLDIDES